MVPIRCQSLIIHIIWICPTKHKRICLSGLLIVCFWIRIMYNLNQEICRFIDLFRLLSTFGKREQMKKTIIAFILSISIAVSSFGSPVFASESVSSKESITSIKQLSTNQKNSIALLNYLMVLTQEINSSQNNKLYLEGVFSSIVNNTNIDVIDSASKDQIDMLLDTIEGYEMIKEKRDRINYIYEQMLCAILLHSRVICHGACHGCRRTTF